LADQGRISDVERGLESSPGSHRDYGRQTGPSEGASSGRKPNIFDFVESKLDQIKQTITSKEQAHAKPGWLLSSVAVDDIYLPFEGTKSFTIDPFDVSVSAMVTYEKIEKDMDQGINYSWARYDYNVGELLYPNQVSGRRPVKTNKMLKEQSETLKAQLADEYRKQSQAQLLGLDDEKAGQRRKQITDALEETTDEMIDRAETDNDFKDAVSNVAVLQESGDPERLYGKVRKTYDEKRDWIRQAAEDRPDSVVNRMRYYRNQATEQALGTGEEGLVVAPKSYTDEERSAIHDKAREKAHAEAPLGFQLTSVDVKFPEAGAARGAMLSIVPAEVEVTATYEGIDARGLPATKTVDWTDSPKLLLEYPNRNRRPIQKI